MREGDVCAVLQGVVYPMVFRKQHDDLLRRFFYGFMNGEADHLCQTGDLVPGELQIV
jgi:hypothetical protein